MLDGYKRPVNTLSALLRGASEFAGNKKLSYNRNVYERALKRMQKKVHQRQYVMTLHADEEMDETVYVDND